MEIEEARQLARRCLALYDLDPAADVQFVKYRENHVFRVDAPGAGSFAVRLHRPGYRTTREIATELRYLDALGRAGVPVPEVVPDREGRLMSWVGEEAARRVVSVQRWIADASPFGDIDGALSGRHDPPAEQFRAIGRLLGRLHASLDAIARPADFERSAWDADGLAGDQPLWGPAHDLAALSPADRDLVRRATARLHERLRAADAGPASYGVIHADATPENVLLTPQGVVLIDFDDFGTGWYAFDLVTAIFHHARNPRYPELEAAMLDGYAEHRVLPAGAREMWDDLMLARGLTYLGWAAERPGDPASDFVAATVAPWVVDIADAFLSGAPSPWRRFPSTARETS